MGGIRRILVATDLSESSARIYPVAAGLAQQTQAELIVAHILDPHEYHELLREVEMSLDEYVRELESTIRYEIGKTIGTDRATRVEVVIRKASVGQDILDLAELLQAEMIIMGTHGRTSLPRILLGSVAEEVIRNAQVPVLVVPMVRRQVRSPVTAASAVPAKEGSDA